MENEVYTYLQSGKEGPAFGSRSHGRPFLSPVTAFIISMLLFLQMDLYCLSSRKRQQWEIRPFGKKHG